MSDNNPPSRGSLEPSGGVGTAVMHACAFWLAYGTLEFATFSLHPLLTWSVPSTPYVITPSHWQWSGILLLCFIAAGVLSGVAGQIAARMFGRTGKAEARIRRLAGGLTLAVVFAAGILLRYPLGISVAFYLLVTALVFTALVLSLNSSGWNTRLDFLTGPWTVAFLLSAAPSIATVFSPELSRTGRVGVWLLALTAIAGISFIGKRTGWISLRAPSFQLATALAAAAIVAGSASVLNSVRDAGIGEAAAKIEGTAKGPNIVLIVMDTVRADHTPLYGYSRDTTPRLREFATQATLYKNSYAVGDMSLPTHATMFTGLFPDQHQALCTSGVQRQPLGQRHDTLAEMLRKAGYATAAVSANSAFVTKDFGFDQGFQVFDNKQMVLLERVPAVYAIRNTFAAVLRRFGAAQDFHLQFRRAEEINAHTFALLDEIKKKEASFFLFLNYMDAHGFYTPPAPFDTMFPGKNPAIDTRDFMNLHDHVNREQGAVSPADRDALFSQYDGGIAYQDEHIGRLFARLKQLGLYDNSLILVTSDHGEHFGEHRVMGHLGVSVYEELIASPLLVKFPGNSQGRTVDIPVTQADFMPTILDAARIERPAGLPGVNLQTADQAPSREIVSTSYPCMSELPRFSRVERAYLTSGTKFIWSTTGKRELYYLSRDRQEEKNQYRSGEPQIQKLAAGLSSWVKAVASTTKMTKSEQVDPEAMRRLRTLGYVQ